MGSTSTLEVIPSHSESQNSKLLLLKTTIFDHIVPQFINEAEQKDLKNKFHIILLLSSLNKTGQSIMLVITGEKGQSQ